MSQTTSSCELRDALSEPGCPICRLKTSTAKRYLDGLLWESVNDPGVRDRLRRSQGFCHEHGWDLVWPGASLGVAILMRDVLTDVLTAVEGAHFSALPALSLRRVRESLVTCQSSAATADLVHLLTPKARCPACIKVEQMEDIYLNTLVDHLLGEDGLLTPYEASDGLCLPHFRQALSHVRDEAVFEAIVGAQQAIWQRLTDQLSEAIRKSDYRFRDEPAGDESGAWLRGIAALSGARATGRTSV